MIFTFLVIFHVLQCISKFSTFFSFPRHISVLKCVFLIFRDFQVSCHIPGPSVCISHFSRFLVISSFFKSSKECFSFSMIFSFLAIFHVLHFLIFHDFQFSCHIPRPTVFLIFHDFHFSCHIPCPTVNI
ncbi:Uncharacterised protein [Chlamydia abortus]|nr:Uncharacterised protein [Chlamydia abortus]